MLPLKNRLKKKKDFDEVFKKGKGIEGFFLFLKIKNNDLKESRFGFIVSQKVSKKAVIRNKTKRRMRAAVTNRKNFIKKGLDIVVMAKKGAERKNFLEIEEELVNLLKKIKVLE
ncbi:MAG: ribonuclease P protein component [Candidatus Nealsonbacteria bacterium]|nr:ribonuclease P protein component [Candidatus Nealsonbacteria bacterium]